jgi:hypothetical protein
LFLNHAIVRDSSTALRFARNDNDVGDMTVDEYRQIALAQPEAVEGSHMNHPDFRVRNKIFATILSSERQEGMVKLTPAQQKKFMKEYPKVFGPATGAWGKSGATIVQTKLATNDIVNRAMKLAWRNTAPKRLLAQIEGE